MTRIVLCLLTAAASVLPAAGATVSGTVTESNRVEIAGVIVSLTAIGIGVPAETYQDTSDRDGVYSIPAVPAGAYQVTAVKSGYRMSNPNDFILVQNTREVNHPITMLPVGAGMKITGTVSDSAAGTGIAGAKVLIQEFGGMGGLVTVDSAITTDGGRYTVDAVQTGTYMITASATGFISKTLQNYRVRGTGVDTIDFLLTAIQTGRIMGVVTADSAKGPGVGGATVVLFSRQGSAIDTATTAEGGDYAFAGVPSGIYSVQASKTDFYSSNQVRATIVGTGTDTVNLVMVRRATGTLHVYVGKARDSSAIAGASITVTESRRAPVTGTTTATGYAVFSGLNTASYTITAAAAGYAPRTATTTLRANAQDTVRIYLAVDTTARKALKGVVIDSASGAKLAGAVVTLRITTGIGGGVLTLFDSTDENGNYLIYGVGVSATSATVVATKTGYLTLTRNNVTMGQIGEADTATLNIRMVKAVTAVTRSPVTSKAYPTVCGIIDARLIVEGVAEGSDLSIYGMNGRRMFHVRTMSAATTSVPLPRQLAIPGSRLIVSLRQNGRILRSMVSVR